MEYLSPLKCLALWKVPARLRRDAEQEGWIALCSGRNPATAIKDFWEKEKLYESREKVGYWNIEI